MSSLWKNTDKYYHNQKNRQDKHALKLSVLQQSFAVQEKHVARFKGAAAMLTAEGKRTFIWI